MSPDDIYGSVADRPVQELKEEVGTGKVEKKHIEVQT